MYPSSHRFPVCLTIGVLLLLAFAAAPVAAQVTVTVDPPIAPLGQPVRITVHNGPAGPIDSVEYWPSVLGPNTVFGPPPPPPSMWPMAPNTSRGWTWDQRDYRTLQPVGPGTLTVAYRYWVGTGPVQTARTTLLIDDVELTVPGTAVHGTTIPLVLRAQQSARRMFQVALAWNDAPAIRIPGGRILALTPDPLFLLTAIPSPLFPTFSGSLDATGFRTITLAIPPDAALVGLRVFAAFVTLDGIFPRTVYQCSYRESFVIG